MLDKIRHFASIVIEGRRIHTVVAAEGGRCLVDTIESFSSSVAIQLRMKTYILTVLRASRESLYESSPDLSTVASSRHSPVTPTHEWFRKGLQREKVVI